MKTLAIIHIAKKEFGLDEDAFRDVLERVTGKRSLRVMSEAERLSVVDDFKARGFKVQRSRGRISPKKYVRLIYALWKSCAGSGVVNDPSKNALRSFVRSETAKRGTAIDDPDFLSYDQASPIIETLKVMEARGKAGDR